MDDDRPIDRAVEDEETEPAFCGCRVDCGTDSMDGCKIINDDDKPSRGM